MLLYFTIIMFLLGDVLRKTSIYFNLDFIRYTGVFKTIVLITYIVFVFVYLKEYTKLEVTKKFIVFSIGLLIVFFLGQTIIKSNSNILSLIRGNLLFLSRYLYWPITIITFLPLITSSNYSNQHLRFFSILFFINAAVILLSCSKLILLLKGLDLWGFITQAIKLVIILYYLYFIIIIKFFLS